MHASVRRQWTTAYIVRPTSDNDCGDDYPRNPTAGRNCMRSTAAPAAATATPTSPSQYAVRAAAAITDDTSVSPPRSSRPRARHVQDRGRLISFNGFQLFPDETLDLCQLPAEHESARFIT